MTPTTLTCSAAIVAALSAVPTLAAAETFAPKVLVMAMFEAEAAPWLKKPGPAQHDHHSRPAHGS